MVVSLYGAYSLITDYFYLSDRIRNVEAIRTQGDKFKEHGGGWDLTLRLGAPDRANALATQRLAEVQEERRRNDHQNSVAVVVVGLTARASGDDVKEACAPGPVGRPGTHRP